MLANVQLSERFRMWIGYAVYKKVRIRLGLQNFHIRTPLVQVKMCLSFQKKIGILFLAVPAIPAGYNMHLAF